MKSARKDLYAHGPGARSRTTVMGNLYGNNTIFERINKKKKIGTKLYGKNVPRVGYALGFIRYGNDWRAHTHILHNNNNNNNNNM